MVELKTDISVINIDWVDRFCKIILNDAKFTLDEYKMPIRHGHELKVSVTIHDATEESIEELNIMLKLKTGMTLLGHINLYCDHHPAQWENKKEEV